MRPRYPGNIGAVARALKNMGFSRLILVSPEAKPTDPEAKWLAVGAADVLRKAKIYKTLDEATHGFHLLIGTSCRYGKKRGQFLPVTELRERLPAGKKIGILFGPEDRGLTTKELMKCQQVVSIPPASTGPIYQLPFLPCHETVKPIRSPEVDRPQGRA